MELHESVDTQIAQLKARMAMRDQLVERALGVIVEDMPAEARAGMQRRFEALAVNLIGQEAEISGLERDTRFHAICDAVSLAQAFNMSAPQGTLRRMFDEVCAPGGPSTP